MADVTELAGGSIAAVVAGLVLSVVCFRRSERRVKKGRVRVAFLGNSILYYNDCPRLLEALSAPRSVTQDSCLRGGSTFASLLAKGNGMASKFASPNALKPDGSHDVGAPTVRALLIDRGPWDFVVLHDYTQGPTRLESRETSSKALVKGYVPLLAKTAAIPVLMQTFAYRRHAKGSEDLGTPPNFTALLQDGYASYAKALAEKLPDRQCPRIAPVATAFLLVHDERPSLWKKLFQPDEYHPSPHGTFLEACVLHCTIFGTAPDVAVPLDPSVLWSRARRMGPSSSPPLSFPTLSEAEYLLQVAVRIVLTGTLCQHMVQTC